MTLSEFLTVMKRSGWLVVATIVVFVVAGAIYVGTASKSYTAKAKVIALTTSATSLEQSFDGSQFIANRIESYAELVDTDLVTRPVISSLSLGLTPNRLAGKISASVPLNTAVINISARDGSASRSADIANSVAAELVKIVADVDGSGGNAIQLKVIQAATPPSAASSPQVVLDLVLAFVLGLAFGIAFALVRSAGKEPAASGERFPVRTAPQTHDWETRPPVQTSAE